MMTSYMLAW